MYLCKLLHKTYPCSRTIDSNDYNELPFQLRAQRTNSEATDYNFSTVQDWLPHTSAPPTYNSLATMNILLPAPTSDFTEATPSEMTTALDQAQINDDFMEQTEHRIVAAEPHLQCQETELMIDDGEESSQQSTSAPVVTSGCSQADASHDSTEVIKPCGNSAPSTDTL